MESAQNRVRQHTIIRAEIFVQVFEGGDPEKGYTMSIPTISPLNFAIQDEIFGGVARVACPAHEHCACNRVIISSVAVTFAAFIMFLSVNSLQWPRCR